MFILKINLKTLLEQHLALDGISDHQDSYTFVFRNDPNKCIFFLMFSDLTLLSICFLKKCVIHEILLAYMLRYILFF